MSLLIESVNDMFWFYFFKILDFNTVKPNGSNIILTNGLQFSEILIISDTICDHFSDLKFEIQ